MPVKIRITLVFTLLVAVILALVCMSIYYFSYTRRVDSIESKLTNRAITIGSLLNQSVFFSNNLVRKIDSTTFLAYTDKIIQAYNVENKKIYEYNDNPASKLEIAPKLLDQARKKKKVFFSIGKKEVVAYHYTDHTYSVVLVAAGYDREGKHNLANLTSILFSSYLAGLVIAGISGYLFAKRLLKPIIKISDEVNHISAQNLSGRINTGASKDEWHYLSTSLNALLNRLQESFDLQKRFIANASHELSTPLTSISSQLEVSLQREREASEYRKVMTSVHKDVVHMGRLTRTLLEFAKASGTPGGIDITPVRIDEILLRLPAEIKKIKPNCPIAFDFVQMPEEENKLLVYGNEELLFTAIKNIVSNACKYSDASITVKLAIDNKVISITVEDKGKGIPEAELGHIFEPFFRANEGKTQEGFGLGLSLAARIIKLHKGEIKVFSQVGSGTTFIIQLPALNS